MKKTISRPIHTIGLFLCALTLQGISADWDSFRQNEARVKAIATNPAAIGDKEIQFLMSHLYYPESITAITKAKTPAAYAALWQMALDGGNGSQTAAYTLIERMTNKLDGVKLLASKNSKVQAIALRGMTGSHGTDTVKLDRRAWEVVKGLLSADSMEVRTAAAIVSGRDSGTEVPAVEKAQALLQTFAGIETLPEAQKQTGYGVHTFLKGARYEFACLTVVNALAEVRGLEEEFLRRQTAEGTGLVRDCVLLARGRRGDEQATEELQRLAREHPSAAFRWEALGAFFKLGTTEDLPWLQQVSEQDPFYIGQWLPGKIGSPEDEVPRDYYSVRERARKLIRAIERQAGAATLPKQSPTK